MKSIFSLIALLATSMVFAQEPSSFQTPPKAIGDLLLSKSSPGVSINDAGTLMLLIDRSEMPTIEDLAQPELRIAGLRINPNNFGPSRSGYSIGLTLKNITTGLQDAISGLPANVKIGNITWSPNQDKIAFTNTTSSQIDLYLIDVKSKKASKVNKQALNEVMGSPFDWYDNNTICYLAATAPASKAPAKPLAPGGPVIQQNLGKVAASRTYQDLIKSAYDEKLFEFYAMAQLVKNTNGVEVKLGEPAIYANFSFSPDGKFLMSETLDKPYSYLVPANGFNSTIHLMDANAKKIKIIAKIPSSELAPSGADNVLNAPRGHRWNPSYSSSLMWIEPLDSGMIKKAVPFHDGLYMENFASNEAPKEIAKTAMRMGAATVVNDKILLLSEFSRAKQLTKTHWLNYVSNEIKLLFERSTNDAYNDPGTPIAVKNSFGKSVPLLVDAETLIMRGSGASKDGDMPFLRSYNVNTKATQELWRCKAPFYETVVQVVDAKSLKFVTSKQSQTETPNYYMYDNGSVKALTNFPDPQPALRQISKEKINYKRADGVDLTADLYLPSGYNKEKDGRLPVIMWAYPREFKSSSDAAQVRGSKYTFSRVNWGSPVFWATQGYAVMDNAEFPIVGEGSKEPNDNFIAQLVSNAKAAIDKVYALGVGDSTRVAVGGHSYGAFMTANLMAHSTLFKAGIARSGAYNRTLTPFGFQNEERTYWEAPELYFKMSPFSYAHQIKTPLLMIHGEADNNPGTFPIQSERLYNAIKGHGGTVRFVQLPFESHGYAAKENLLHLLWEQHQWLERYLKGRK